MKLTEEQISRLEYGKSQFPWLAETINEAINDPTKENLEKLLEKAYGTLKTAVENIIKEDTDK